MDWAQRCRSHTVVVITQAEPICTSSWLFLHSRDAEPVRLTVGVGDGTYTGAVTVEGAVTKAMSVTVSAVPPTVSKTSLVPLISCLPKLARELPTAPKGCAELPAPPPLLLLLGLPPAPPPEPSAPLCTGRYHTRTHNSIPI